MDAGALIARRLLLPVARWKDGRRYFNHYLREFEQSQYYSPERLRDLQSEWLRALVAHAYQHTAYYRRLFDSAAVDPASVRDPEDLRRLPTLSKQQVRLHLPDLLADNYPLQTLIQDHTGGSTGMPLQLYRDHRCHDVRLAAAIRHERWTGWEVGERLAYIWGAPRDLGPAEALRWRLSKRFAYRMITLYSSALDDASMVRFAQALQRWRPTLVVAYAGCAYLVAKFLRERGLRLPPPKGVVCSSELLQPRQRPVIEAAFGAPVFDRYGCHEFGMIASECAAHQGLHIAADRLLLEVLADGAPAAPGQPGEIVITDLWNYAMPMIRYHIGDLGVLGDRRCDCGRPLPLLEMLTGRTTDFLVTPAGKMISGSYLASVPGTRPGLEQVQFVQEVRDRVVVRVVPGEQFTQDDLLYLIRRLQQLMGPGVTFSHELVKEIPRDPGGKYQFCICKVPTDLTRDVLPP